MSIYFPLDRTLRKVSSVMHTNQRFSLECALESVGKFVKTQNPDSNS